MANDEHLEKLKRGAKVWNIWRKEYPNIEPDISSVILIGEVFREESFEDELYAFFEFSDATEGWPETRLIILDEVNLLRLNQNKQGVLRKLNILVCTDLKSVNFSRVNLKRAIITGNFSKANFSGADLLGANIAGANFSGTFLYMANLELANIGNIDFSGADLTKAYLRKAVFRDTNLRKASFAKADLSGVYFRGVDLSGADLTNCYLSSTNFTNVDLSEVKGLEKIHHLGPSFISIDTIYKSQGIIPDSFLRGAGVTEHFIKYMQSLKTEPIQFYSCFISYSTKDQGFAERLHADLQSKGVRVWFAPEDIKGGRKLHEQIPEAIRHYDKLLLVLSENSMQSEWVKTEVYHARQDEIRDNKRKLFPIGLVEFSIIRDWTAFDADVGKDMAREIREYFIPDFSNWIDHDSYKKAFDRLLRDLNLGAEE